MRVDPSRGRAHVRAPFATRASRRACRRLQRLAPAIGLRAILTALLGCRWLRALAELARASAAPGYSLAVVERRPDRIRPRRARID
ncbi:MULTISPECIES: hypothetical protein [Burkholderia]|uniref:hypothetical protein n=1 Tax=Burkholderia TaxID=32008 RepID=UPI00075D896A|nr:MULTISPECIES: hypothetical protein [Burkholderia]AOJ72909.1 hypothetical protein WS78_30060 [Burkholderia savannae]AOJ84563.1 hypothetical protein WS86_29005 [Burkholderia savannae]KVG44861.1 hypothetical protein WS77_06690 [Burkholderia sp. MSMB0265]KVG79647.1 hypothetical protein WS81_14465 [Burkholderia sp. MSMB2040]KVG95986.1 hypothetical protein WS82_02100 [Burkholderia sp. MSMB2041]